MLSVDLKEYLKKKDFLYCREPVVYKSGRTPASASMCVSVCMYVCVCVCAYVHVCEFEEGCRKSRLRTCHVCVARFLYHLSSDLHIYYV